MAWAVTEAVLLLAAFLMTFLFGVKWGVELERVRKSGRREQS
jgi:hypothetical protein